jgi:two-component system, LytTR family, response regulator LytT
MKILIIEDEPLAAKQLIGFINDYYPEAVVLGIVNSVSQCIDWFDNNEQPELIFSDIELLDGNVFNFYDKQTIECPIIFTTAYDQFLLKAFEVSGIAYLLKPFTGEMVKKAMAKYYNLQNKNQPAIGQDVLHLLQQSLLQKATNNFKQRFSIKTKNGIYLLPVNDVAFIKADGVLLFAFDAAGKKYPLTGTLTAIEEQLDPDSFFRINRSDVINISTIEKIAPHAGDRLAIYIKGQKDFMVTSTQKTAAFRKWIEK